MQNVSIDYPAVPWEPDWRLCSEPEDSVRFITQNIPGAITTPGSDWTLQLTKPSLPLRSRLFHNGLSIHIRKQKKNKSITAFSTGNGILNGLVTGLPMPELSGSEQSSPTAGETWIRKPGNNTLLLCKESRFVLITGNLPDELAIAKAEEALDQNFDAIAADETKQRERISKLFSINPRHNPPVALAAETLHQRLRGRTPSIHGVWSTSDGFENETFSLNELYPLTRAWLLLCPETALELVQTALALQLPSGGFPAWINDQGAVSSVAPWPMMIQSFELAWQKESNSALLKKHLPAMRKYMQWALRYYDPHRDRIPAWQSDMEVFVPNSFERNKATPDLTVMLMGELEALLRLCRKNEYAQTAIDQLNEEHAQLTHTLTSVFWNPETKAFSNVWKDGHILHEPSFGSFTPLCRPDLPAQFKSPLLENFEETHGFPGRDNPSSWKKEQIDDTTHLPAIQQFMAFDALRCSDDGRALLMLFVRRAREGFAAWFERERIDTARHEAHEERSEKHIFSLGPITAALILTTQKEFQREAVKNAPAVKTLQRWAHRFRFDATDLRIIIGVGITILLVHLLYHPIRPANEATRMSEAALNYKQGNLTKALQICRQYPDNPLSCFLRANLMMLTENPAEAEKLYLKTLNEKIESPSALFGYALSLQMNEKFDLAIRRYNDFIDIHEAKLRNPNQTDLIDLAYEYLRLTEEKFTKPPKWKRAYMLPEMNDLGL
ncbi:hypothetical protein [Tichowtungia aerotolerans]|uniref:Tetratricopeptide repeat protein n=1 Tax=Tichowtungia aerotolerans TaxID=2697043 RepID=A0A6P1M074_9BACT|nr:hypothetical protein [Tichowtungia aerotolerans]QHI68199.1 hypothetical protein GT409_01615 [Tichowtungia aerotolerans]